MYKLIILILLIASLSSCSNTSSPANNSANVNIATEQSAREPHSITIKANSDAPGGPFELTGDLRYGAWYPSEQRFRDTVGTAQTYCISTSPNVAAQTKGLLVKELNKGDAFEICFSINENKRFADDRPVEPKAYYVTRDMGEIGKLGRFDMRMVANEKEALDLMSPDRTYGPLTIEESTVENIAGTIAMSDEHYTISGDFDASLLKR